MPEFKRVAIEELTAAGFEVSVFRTAPGAGRRRADPRHADFIASETQGYTDKYDAALILANVSDFAQQGALRIKWSMPMGPEMPWYAAEVPTVFVSLNMPNHLIDVPMVKTAINAHNPTAETVKSPGGQARRTQRVHRHPQRQRLVRFLGHPPISLTEQCSTIRATSLAQRTRCIPFAFLAHEFRAIVPIDQAAEVGQRILARASRRPRKAKARRLTKEVLTDPSTV